MIIMDRREAIKKAVIMLGGMIALPDILKAHENPFILNPSFILTGVQEDVLAEMADTIIPTTDTPGAKAAGVPQFIKKMLADCYEKKDSEAVMQGLDKLETDAKAKYGKGFAQITNEERIAMLKEVEATKSSFWRIMKDLTVTGYFTSEIGCTQALRYEQVPGKYIGDLPYKKGDKAWAT
jgi:Gluconate 2-dehydrogenase subunit 3